MDAALQHDDNSQRVVLVIPTLNEEQSIAEVVRNIPRQVVSRIIVTDGGSGDATAARAKAAGADVIDAGQGYGRACLAATMAADDADILVFMDGDGADAPQGIVNLVEPIQSGRYDFVIGSRARGKREPGSIAWHQLAAGRLAGWGMRLLIRRAIHGYVRVACDSARYPAGARNARVDIRLEYRDADARRPSGASHPGNPSRLSPAHGGSVQGGGELCPGLFGRAGASLRPSSGLRDEATVADGRNARAAFNAGLRKCVSSEYRCNVICFPARSRSWSSAAVDPQELSLRIF